MFRILVADDEGIMIESIKNCITANFGSNCEIMCVKTGRAVIEQAESFRPDIAFVDIQMPGISGIQAIQEVQKFNSSIVFIIITAYDKFSYAQEAVKLGVMEFITKPVNKKKILDACIRAMRQVEESRQELRDNLMIRERLEIVIPIIESGFIYSIVQDDVDIYSLGYPELLNIQKQYGFMVVLECGDEIRNGSMINVVGVNVKISKYYVRIREIIKDYLECIIGPVMGNRIVLFITFDHEKARYEERVEIITRIRNMIYKLEENMDVRFRGGIGTIKKITNVKDSYKEALKALRESDSHVVHIMDIAMVTDCDDGYPVDMESRYFRRGLKADLEGTETCANEFFDWMVEHSGNARSNIEIKILELVIELEKRAYEAGYVHYGFCYRENYLAEIQGTADINMLRQWFLRKTREICEKIETSREREYENVISRVKSYINENYAKDISLEEASQMVDISPYYFSKLFKQEVGETFIEYLTRTRISNARRLLDDPRYSIKEVCVMCGYGDPNYFSRVFKKYENMTPSEYRER